MSESDSYGLWGQACFDLARIIGTVTNYDVIPYQSLIQSISIILSVDKEGLPVFRFKAVCLVLLFSYD